MESCDASQTSKSLGEAVLFFVDLFDIVVEVLFIAVNMPSVQETFHYVVLLQGFDIHPEQHVNESASPLANEDNVEYYDAVKQPELSCAVVCDLLVQVDQAHEYCQNLSLC